MRALLTIRKLMRITPFRKAFERDSIRPLVVIPAPVWSIEDLMKVRSLPEPEKTAFKAELMARLTQALVGM